VRTRIKFCGMTSAEDVALAVSAGADAVGIIVAQSERQVSIERAAEIARSIPPFVTGVGVLAEDTSLAPALRDAGLVLQFSGPTSPDVCERLAAGKPYLKAFHVALEGEIETGALEFSFAAYEHALWMFDSSAPGLYGGTGIAFRWEVVGELARDRRIVISGGLSHENVGALLGTVRPYAVDVRTGIERDGKIDFDRMFAFVRAVRDADRAADASRANPGA
jgi:phosphoribosylanthranilate isomerase